MRKAFSKWQHPKYMGNKKMAKKSHLHIEFASVSWGKVKGLQKRLNQATELTLASLPEALIPAARVAEMTLLLTTDKAVQTLNHDYRGMNKPTNVLSFPHFERRELTKMAKLGLPLYVGDIAVAYQYVVKEAKAEQKMLLDHVTHLVIHGILHLFGYDHDTDARAARMEKMERELMASLGLLDPYAPVQEVPSKLRRSAKKRK